MAKKTKEPGRIKQLLQIYKMTIASDKTALWWALLALGIGVLGGTILGATLGQATTAGFVVWIITGLLIGFLSGLIVMSRKAEQAAYGQIEGQPGAVSAVLRSALKRGWRGSEVPIAVNRNQDAVYRAIGPAGVVLIGEGVRTRVQPMLEDERRKVQRAVPGVDVKFVYVTQDSDGVRLIKLAPTMLKMKRVLTRNEVGAIDKRLSALVSSLPIPKGIDPKRARAQRR
jgi:F0F1-type ATP synthase assembly protein I